MSLLKALGGAGSAASAKLYPEDVFSTYLYPGNGATQTITNGIDLAGKGGMVWIKARNAANGHALFDTARGFNGSSGYYLETSDTHAQIAETGFSAFTSSGFSLATNTTIGINNNLGSYSSWTFRKAPKFFDIVTYTGDGTANRVLNHSLGQEVGMIETKATSTSGDWNTYHRSATGDLVLNTSVAQTASKTIIPSATTTTFTVNGVANTNGVTYVAYLYAHDASADGIIQCGSFTTDGSGNATVNLGWEPQDLMHKNTSTTGNWFMLDTMRGLNMSTTDATLTANTSNAEDNTSTRGNPTAIGFDINGGNASATVVYMAIRRPMKVPTSGTEVYSSSVGSGVIASGFTVDAHLGATRAGLATNHRFHSRLQGGTKELVTSTTAAETTVTDLKFDAMNGLGFSFAASESNHFFKRAKEFLDIVCYTGTGVARTVNHNLGVAPELMIVKNRTVANTEYWAVFVTPLGKSSMLKLQAADAVYVGGYWGNTMPTSTGFTVSVTNEGDTPYVAYLFATLAGISKVGSYTGNGTSQTISCGFTTGARFVLIKRTDSTGDWYIWDTVRGIVAANDPHLSLNTTAAEVTTDDSVDPEASGFIVNQVAATNVNVSAATYIYLAIA